MEEYENAGNKLMYLETEHLILRKARLDDLDSIWHNVWEDASIAEKMLWKTTTTLEDATDRIKRTINYQSQIPAYFVCLKESDEPIGFAGIKEEKPGVFEDCGICIASKYQGRGYGKEVVNALIYLAFDLLHGKEFIYGCFHENEKSKGLAKSLGFKYTHSVDEVRKWDGYQYQADYFLLRNSTIKPEHGID